LANLGSSNWPNAQIYGGVLRDVRSVETWLEDSSTVKDPDIRNYVGTVVGVGLIALDVPLSAVGDTLTLPVTIPLARRPAPASDPNVSRKDAASPSEASKSVPAPAPAPAPAAEDKPRGGLNKSRGMDVPNADGSRGP
jgi:hypothetical protein